MINNNLIINKTSTGKTRGYMFNELERSISNNENLLIIDNKEEYYRTYAETLKNNGYNVLVVNFKTPEESNGFNPLLLAYNLYQKGIKDKATRIINQMAKSITYEEQSGDIFWSNSAADYMTGLCLILFKHAQKEEINIGSIQAILSQLEIKENFNNFIEYLNNLSVISSEYIYLSGTALAPIETRGGIISVLRSELNKIVGSESLLNLLSTNEIDLFKLPEKTAIFIISNETHSELSDIVISEINSLEEKEFTYILDNADTLTKISCLSDLLENSKIKNNKVYYLSRNKETIIDKYGKYFIDKFENIITDTTKYPLKNIGNYNSFSKLQLKENKYFNIKDIFNK